MSAKNYATKNSNVAGATPAPVESPTPKDALIEELFKAVTDPTMVPLPLRLCNDPRVKALTADASMVAPVAIAMAALLEMDPFAPRASVPSLTVVLPE